MDQSFSWQNFDRMAHVLETLGFFVLILGPLIGLGMLIFASGYLSIIGLVVILGSVLVALYHISFSFLMHAIRGIIRDIPKLETPKAE